MDFTWIVFAIFLLIVGSVCGLLIYARWNYGTLEALNLPVVNRSLFLGSISDLHVKVQHLEDIERFRKYGGVYGVYEGRSPQVHICDPELIRRIFVKDCDHFIDRRRVELGDPLMNEMLDFLPYQKWKVLRQMQTPTLTGSKLKLISVRLEESVTEFIRHTEGKLDKSTGSTKIDCRHTFVPLAIDMLARGLFGLRIENPFDYGNSFAQNFRDLMGEGNPPNILYTMSFSFPILTSLAPAIFSGPVNFFANLFRNIIQSRSGNNNSGGSEQNDFPGKLKDMMDKLETEEFKNLEISEKTVLAQAIGPFLAGYDAQASTTTFLLHYLATNLTCQEKLHSEIDSHVETYGSIQYEHLNEMKYLNACLKETLRLAPAFIRPERLCTKNWEYNGVKITKGCAVMIPAWAANRNPECFSNPDEFDPERFMDESSTNQYGFNTFGHGPRNCIGMKYAYDALKLSLSHILRNFEFRLRPDTLVNFKTGVVWFIMYDPIYLNMIRR